MTRPSGYLELRCSSCSWTEVCGPEAVLRWLRKAGKLRSQGEHDLEILYEVFRSAAGGLTCPECGKKGLAAGPALEDQVAWPGATACSACGKAISPERLEAVPGATLCAACQRDDELGHLNTDFEYCPKCGAVMELRVSKKAGLTRYTMACTGTPPCRL